MTGVFLVVAFSLSNLLASRAQTGSCPSLPLTSQVDSFLTTLLINQEGEGSNINVDIVNTHYTCQAQGTSFGSYRALSAIVTYRKNGNSAIEVRQIEMICVDVGGGRSEWDRGNDITVPASGFESLETRKDCSTCSSSAGNSHHCQGEQEVK